MKHYTLILSIILLLTTTGCVTQDELRYVTRSLDAKIARVQDGMSALQGSVENNRDLIGKNEALIKRSDASNQAARQSQADASADVIALRDNVQKLRGAIEELKYDIKNFKSASATPAGSQDFNKKLAAVASRVATIEKHLEINGGEPVRGASKKKSTRTPPENKLDNEKLYSEAYKIFKDGEYARARAKFKEFLKHFPDTEYSDNAQFWIGECFYFQEKYEEAILEFEKVIQNYPKGNKVPNALLKQALSFLKLADKSSSRLLLQQVVKDYPGTTPARIARSKLLEIK